MLVLILLDGNSDVFVDSRLLGIDYFKFKFIFFFHFLSSADGLYLDLLYKLPASLVGTFLCFL